MMKASPKESAMMAIHAPALTCSNSVKIKGTPSIKGTIHTVTEL